MSTNARKKICRKCGRYFVVNSKHFRKNNSSPDGFRATCKQCEDIKNPRKDFSELVPFFSTEVLLMCKHNKFIEVQKFGIFYGIIIKLRENDWLAFSITTYKDGGSKTFTKENDAKAFLYKCMVIAGEKTKIGLTRTGRGRI